MAPSPINTVMKNENLSSEEDSYSNMQVEVKLEEPEEIETDYDKRSITNNNRGTLSYKQEAFKNKATSEDSQSSSIEYRDKMLDTNAGGIDETSMDLDSKLTNILASLKSPPDVKVKKALKVGIRKRKRKLIYPWPHQSEVSALIAAVRKRLPLWDGGCSDYRLANIKNDCWQQVAGELGIPEVDAFEARNKWNVVRSLFKANLAKFRAKQSGQAASDIVTVPWTHFSEMLFIESSESAQFPSTTSTMALEGAFTDTSMLTDLSQASTSRSHTQTVEPNNVPTGAKRKKSSKPRITLTPTSTPASSPSRCGCMRDLAGEVLTSLHTRSQGDRLTSFTELVERNLRSLPVNESLQLEGQIMNLMYQFLSSRTDPLHNIDSLEGAQSNPNGYEGSNN